MVVFKLMDSDMVGQKYLKKIKNKNKAIKIDINSIYYQNRPLVDVNNRKNIFKLNNINPKYHNIFLKGIETGQNIYSQKMEDNLVTSCFNQQKINVSQSLQKHNTNRSMNILHNMNSNRQNKSNHGIKWNNTSSNGWNTSNNGILVDNNSNLMIDANNRMMNRQMEFRKTKLIGLDRKGNTNVGEIVKLAKSIALSNYEKNFDGLIKNRNSMVLGKSISNLTYMARSKDYHSFKRIQVIDDKLFMNTIRSQFNPDST